MATANPGSRSFPTPEMSPLTVALRIRPISEEEIDRGGSITAHAALDQTMVVLLDPSDDPDDILRQNRNREKQYMFDHVFDAIATQEEVYEKTTKGLIKWVINGYNATVFAYGATGCGKTYTMLGNEDSPGIMARTLNDLFLEMNNNADNRYQVTMSYFELYNEMIRDLLNPSAGLLDLREDNKGRNVVAGLSEVETATTEDIMAMLVQGNLERTQEPTAANLTSSRSHAILQVSVRQQSRVRDTNAQVKVGRLFLIDLAGSERAAHTKNRGKRMVEGAHINRSLLALGNCINALVEKGPKAYVNYRDSKLTRLLKDSLGGNSMTVMIAHISPASQNFEESRNTLLYADRAKNIKNTVKRNVMDVTYHIAQYQSIIGELREEISRLRKKITEQDGDGVGSTAESNSDGGRSNLQTASGVPIAVMKEQLVNNFREQMELRRKLMETNAQSLELSLEQSRHLMVVHDWEGERVVKKKLNPLADHTIDNKDMEEMEKGTLESLALIGSPDEPPEIVMARDQLKNLNVQRQRLESEKEAHEADLLKCREKASRLEDSLPGNIGNNGDHREILSLLCKVHELEIENTESQSAILLKDHEMRKKDMIIERYEHNRMLCDQIMQQQRGIVVEHDLPVPEELEELYDQYLQLNDSGEMSGGTPTQLNPTKLQSVATLLKVFGKTEVESLNLRSERSTLASEDNSPRHETGANRTFKMPVVDVDDVDDALGSTSSSNASSKPTNKHVVNVDKKLFRESAKSKKIFSKKNHQDSAPELLEGAAARLSGDAVKRNGTFTNSKPGAPNEACLVSLSDPCSPIASPTEERNESDAGGKPLKLNKTNELRGPTPISNVAAAAPPKSSRHLLPLSNSEGLSDVASDGVSFRPKTETISVIAARRASRISRNDGGRLSISVNDLTEVGRANQTGSSLSYVSSIATHDGVIRLNTNHNNRRQDVTAAAAPFGGGGNANALKASKKVVRDRSPDDVSNASVSVKSKNAIAVNNRNADRRRRTTVGQKNAFDSNGVDPNRPWRQSQQQQQQQQSTNRRLKAPNVGGRIWFPRDQPGAGKDKSEPLQPLLSREAAPTTTVGQNNAHGNGLTVVRRNRGFHHANTTSSSNNSTPAGHQGAPPVAAARKRNGRGMNAPAGFHSNRASQQNNNNNNSGNGSGTANNGTSEGSGGGFAITGHALKNGDLF